MRGAYIHNFIILFTHSLGEKSYLNKTCSTIKIQMQILNLPKFTKWILQIIFLCLFMNSGDQNNPAFNSCKNYPPQDNYVEFETSRLVSSQNMNLRKLYIFIQNCCTYLILRIHRREGFKLNYCTRNGHTKLTVHE